MSGSKSLVKRGVIEPWCFLGVVKKEGLGEVAWAEVEGGREEESWSIFIGRAESDLTHCVWLQWRARKPLSLLII